MSSFDFEEVWPARRTFEVGGVAIPAAKLSHVVEPSARAGRQRDRLFLATHREALSYLLRNDETDS